jgi:hypothetical protein
LKNLETLEKVEKRKTDHELIIEKYKDTVRNFRKSFSYFERSKSRKGIYRVADGITRDAIFCMRDILREYPQLYLTRKTSLGSSDFVNILSSSYAQKIDLKLTSIRLKHIKNFSGTV